MTKSTGVTAPESSGASKPAGQAVPRLIAALSFVIIGICSAMMLLGAWAVGMTWDENVHVKMHQTLLKFGWNVTPDALINGLPDPNYYYGFYLYGPMTEILGHVTNVVLRIEHWGHPVATASAYGGRHTAVALIAVVGICSVVLTVRLITNSWAWGWLSGAALAATPLWTGHGMFNIKDTPVATGFALATLGLVALTQPRYPSSWRLRTLAIGSITAGTALAMGTRSSMVFAIGCSAIATVIAVITWNIASPKGTVALPRVPQRIAEGALGGLLAYAIMLVIYPNAYRNPFRLLKESMASSAHYPVSDSVLTAGHWLAQPVPWYYLPLWFAAQLPLLVIVFAALFVAAWTLALVRHLGRRAVLGARRRNLWIVNSVPIFGMAFLMYPIAVTQHSAIYNGSRQFLFMVPAFTMMAVLGVWRVVTSLRKHPTKTPWPLRAVWVVVGLGLVLPVVDQVRLFPYNYVYFNEVARLAPIDGNWPTDYWRASGQDLIRRLPADGPESCWVVPSLDAVRPCQNETQFAPFWDLRGKDARAGTLGPGEYWLMRENGGDTVVPDSCELFDRVSRPLGLQTLTIGQILKCSTTS